MYVGTSCDVAKPMSAGPATVSIGGAFGNFERASFTNCLTRLSESVAFGAADRLLKTSLDNADYEFLQQYAHARGRLVFLLRWTVAGGSTCALQLVEQMASSGRCAGAGGNLKSSTRAKESGKTAQKNLGKLQMPASLYPCGLQPENGPNNRTKKPDKT
jgi:type IV pilus biogenesis protein CpaD/CtpE